MTRNQDDASADGSTVKPQPVRLVRDSATLFLWETTCPNCAEPVFEAVPWSEADCERCGVRVRVDLLRKLATVRASGL